MNPEEPLMSLIRVSLCEGRSGVLEQEFSNHGLSNGMYNSRIRTACYATSSSSNAGTRRGQAINANIARAAR
jgi:hypothetical protein